MRLKICFLKLLLFTENVIEQCKDDEFQCNSGECIKFFQRCDMVVDCPNGEDESFCRMFLLLVYILYATLGFIKISIEDCFNLVGA